MNAAPNRAAAAEPEADDPPDDLPASPEAGATDAADDNADLPPEVLDVLNRGIAANVPLQLHTQITLAMSGWKSAGRPRLGPRNLIRADKRHSMWNVARDIAIPLAAIKGAVQSGGPLCTGLPADRDGIDGRQLLAWIEAEFPKAKLAAAGWALAARMYREPLSPPAPLIDRLQAELRERANEERLRVAAMRKRYSEVIRRCHTPEPNDAATIVELMEPLDLTEKQILADIKNVAFPQGSDNGVA